MLHTILKTALLLGVFSVTTVCAVPPPLPDFVIASMSINPTNAVEKAQVTVTVTVKNQGDIAGDGRYLDLWYNATNGSPVFGDVGDWWAPVGSLQAGESRTLTAPPHFVDHLGTNQLFACIEFENLISEVSNTNNCRVFSYDAAPVESLIAPAYHFWSKTYRSHYYTTSEAERDYEILRNSSWIYKGPAFYVYTDLVLDAVPVYHFWSKTYRSHYYTTSEAERDYEMSRQSSWIYKGAAFYAFENPVAGAVPVYHFWSKTYRSHYYTTSEAERDYEISRQSSWIYKGVAFYAFPTANPAALAAFSILDASEDLPKKTLGSEKSLDCAVESVDVILGNEIDGYGTTDILSATPSNVGDVIFPLHYPGCEVMAYIYDSASEQWTCVLSATNSPASVVLENVQPDRNYLLDVFAADQDGGEIASVHQSWFTVQLDPPETIHEGRDAGAQENDGGVGSPIVRIKTPVVAGPLTVKLYSSSQGVVETLTEVPASDTVELAIPEWNRWYWVGGWRDVDDELVLSIWLRHERE